MAPNITILKLQESINTKSTGSTTSASSLVGNIWGNNIIQEGYQDALSSNSKNGLTPEEQKKYNEIYKKLEALCKDQNIEINLAKKYNLLGRILGKTEKELVNTAPKEIDYAIKVLQEHLGFGDGTGFGKKDKTDLDKIVKDVQNKIAREKVGGSWIGQAWHKAKTSVGLNSINKASTPEEIAKCYKEAYLEDINNLSPAEVKTKYSNMLAKFYYDFNVLSDNPEKQVAMTKAIALLATDHRDLIIEIMATQLKNNPRASEAFGKALNVNFKEITTTSDAQGNVVNQIQATKISNISYSIMSEEDVKKALDALKKDATKFYKEYGEKIEELKARRDKGESLSEAEIKLLTEAENVYEGQYAGAYTGISSNNNILETNQIKLINQINNDTQEIGIQEEVLEVVNNFIEENPDKLGISKEKFEELLNEATNNEYSNHNNNRNNSSAKANNNIENNNNKLETNLNSTNSSTKDNTSANETVKSSKTEGSIGYATKNLENKSGVSKTISTTEEEDTSVTKEETEKDREEKQLKTNNRKDLMAAVREGGVKAFYEVLSEGNETAIIADALNNKSLVGNDILNAAKNIYKSAKSMQINILERLSSIGIQIVDGITTLATWNKAVNKTFGSFEVTRLIQEKAKENIEENKK